MCMLRCWRELSSWRSWLVWMKGCSLLFRGWSSCFWWLCWSVRMFVWRWVFLRFGLRICKFWKSSSLLWSRILLISCKSLFVGWRSLFSRCVFSLMLMLFCVFVWLLLLFVVRLSRDWVLSVLLVCKVVFVCLRSRLFMFRWVLKSGWFVMRKSWLCLRMFIVISFSVFVIMLVFFVVYDIFFLSCCCCLCLVFVVCFCLIILSYFVCWCFFFCFMVLFG